MRAFALATWNVHGWVGRDGRRDPARSFEVIDALAANVVALQEAHGTDWEAMARKTGYRVLLGPTQTSTGAPYGNALLVRAPVLSLHRIDLSVAGREPRGALDATVRLGPTRLRVVATHLGLSRSERRRQASVLAERITADDRGLDTALLGDLNDWTRRGRQLGPLARAVAPMSRVSTFPSRRPVLPLDRIAFRGAHRALRVASISTQAARTASDHLPLEGVCHEPGAHSAP